MLFELYLIDISTLGFSLWFVEVTVNSGSSSTFFGGCGMEEGVEASWQWGQRPHMCPLHPKGRRTQQTPEKKILNGSTAQTIIRNNIYYGFNHGLSI